MTREDRAREALFAKQVQADWRRDGWDEPAVHDDKLVAAMLAFADAEAAAMRERAALECERIEAEYWTKWKTDYDMHDQGMSNGAALAAEAVRALPTTG